MEMSYLNLDLDFFNHPKTLRLVGLLGRGSDSLPPKLWCYCGKFHTKDGQLDGYSEGEIETILGWWGEPGKMVDAMLRVGFLERMENGFAVHDWKNHSGHLYALQVRASNAAKSRWHLMKSRNAKGSASGTAKAVDKHSPILVGMEGQEGLESLGIKEGVWGDFIEHRKKARKPLTKRACELALKALAKLKDEGNDPNDVIEQSILRGWLGLFPIQKSSSTPSSESSVPKSWSTVDRMRKRGDR